MCGMSMYGNIMWVGIFMGDGFGKRVVMLIGDNHHQYSKKLQSVKKLNLL